MDEDLIRRAQAGDQDAFRQMMAAYSALAWRTARVALSDPIAAEDALQDAWLDIWRGLPRFQVGQPLRPWLLTVVANRCRMSVRRRALLAVPIDADDGATRMLIAQDDPSQRVLQTEADAELRAALETLRADQQRVLELRFFADLDLAEMALVMGTPTGTVKSRLHRALAALRARLTGERTAPGQSGKKA
jgi:RNA polymerase sigma factor (sigma-70 family)